jgi:hypothetical protein
MAGIYTSQADSIAADVKRIREHLERFEANTPNNQRGPAILARTLIKELHKRLDKLERMLGNAVSPNP